MEVNLVLVKLDLPETAARLDYIVMTSIHHTKLSFSTSQQDEKHHVMKV